MDLITKMNNFNFPVVLIPYQWIVSYSLYKSMLERHTASVDSPDVAATVVVPIPAFAI